MAQHISPVFISGVSEDAAIAFLGQALFQALNAHWVAPEYSVAHAQEEQDAQWLWLYQPPWQWQLNQPAPAQWEAWVTQHQPALRLRRIEGERLHVVNVARTSAHALAETLGASAPCPESEATPAYLDALAALCAGMAASSPALRHAWEVYETLEATAWLPSGQAPEFRASLDPGEPSLVALLGLLNAGIHAPVREQAHQETQATLAALRQEHAALQETHNATCAKQQETGEENDLFLTQLHHVQETLEAHHLENQQQQQQLNELKNVSAEVAKLNNALSEQKQATLNAQQAQSTAEQASVSDKQAAKALNQQLETLKRDGAKKLATLQEQLTALRASLDAATAESADTQEENDLLLTQLHHVQETLEAHHLEGQQQQQQLNELKNVSAEVAKLNKALSEQKQATLNAQQAQSTAEQASVGDKQAVKTLNQQLETLKRDGDKKLASLQEQLTALRTSLGAATAESAETQEENDLLLTQLHHVQEELERYFLANREYQTTLGSAQRTFLRTRQHISRLAARTPQGSVTA
jgi:DNA repair exonuclease SbcCD ATPase subunit